MGVYIRTESNGGTIIKDAFRIETFKIEGTAREKWIVGMLPGTCMGKKWSLCPM